MLYPVTSLSHLDLSRNQLNSLDERAISRLSYISTVHLADNPWKCDTCHLYPVFDAAVNLNWMKSAFCFTPERLRNRSIISLVIEEVSACDEIIELKKTSILSPQVQQFLVIVIISTCVFAIILSIGIFAGKLCKRRHVGSYYTGGRKRKKNEPHGKKSIRVNRSTVAIIDDYPKCFELKPLTVANGKL